MSMERSEEAPRAFENQGDQEDQDIREVQAAQEELASRDDAELPSCHRDRQMLSSSDMNESPLVIPSGLFPSAKPTQRNDRYVVYHMLGRMVTFKDPSSGSKISGFCDEVYRDIFIGEIRVKIRGRVYKFKEPAVVRAEGNGILFLYGDVGTQDLSDATLFKEMKSGQFRETVGDTIRRTTPRKVKKLRFTLGERKPSRRKPLLMRGITANLSAVSS